MTEPTPDRNESEPPAESSAMPTGDEFIREFSLSELMLDVDYLPPLKEWMVGHDDPADSGSVESAE